MPYVDQATKDSLDHGYRTAETPGELTYVVTAHLLMLDHYDTYLVVAIKQEIADYLGAKKLSYALLSSVVGCLECARREFIRRRPTDSLVAHYVLNTVLDGYYNDIVAPYEDDKIQQNGDVF
jgi:hypothetical protein